MKSAMKYMEYSVPMTPSPIFLKRYIPPTLLTLLMLPTRFLAFDVEETTAAASAAEEKEGERGEEVGFFATSGYVERVNSMFCTLPKKSVMRVSFVERVKRSRLIAGSDWISAAL